MTYSNPNGEKATMPVLMASEQAIMPVTGGLLSWLSSSNPAEHRSVI